MHNATVAYGSMTDQEGNVYRTVEIGTQTWMAENLKTTKYRNGTSISNITDNTQWANNTTGAYCSYNNDTSNDCPYGKFYNWYAVNNTNQLCPTGWHVPTDAEWTTLTSFLGGQSVSGGQSVAGGKMKSTGTQYWTSPNTGASNSSGWSGLPGGRRGGSGSFFIDLEGYWWSSTEFNATSAWMRYLTYDMDRVYKSDPFNKLVGLSVRCIKD